MTDAPAADDKTHLVWSNEHRGWWAPARFGYVRSHQQAGRYSHAEALAIASNALPGNTTPPGMLPEIPVALADIETVKQRFDTAYPDHEPEPWE